jgi:Ca2+-binding EF-hand superfamily protein
MAKKAFDAFDRDNSGSVDINEFLLGLRVSLNLCRSTLCLFVANNITPYFSTRMLINISKDVEHQRNNGLCISVVFIQDIF